MFPLINYSIYLRLRSRVERFWHAVLDFFIKFSLEYSCPKSFTLCPYSAVSCFQCEARNIPIVSHYSLLT